MAAQFRSYVWDPALIVAQMVLLQAAYYSSLGLWLALLGALGSTGPSLHQIFSDEVRVRAVGLAPRQALSVCPCVRFPPSGSPGADRPVRGSVRVARSRVSALRLRIPRVGWHLAVWEGPRAEAAPPPPAHCGAVGLNSLGRTLPTQTVL